MTGLRKLIIIRNRQARANLKSLKQDLQALEDLVRKYGEIRVPGRRLLWALTETKSVADLGDKLSRHEQTLQMWYMTLVLGSLRRIEGGVEDIRDIIDRVDQLPKRAQTHFKRGLTSSDPKRRRETMRDLKSMLETGLEPRTSGPQVASYVRMDSQTMHAEKVDKEELEIAAEYIAAPEDKKTKIAAEATQRFSATRPYNLRTSGRSINAFRGDRPMPPMPPPPSRPEAYHSDTGPKEEQPSRRSDRYSTESVYDDVEQDEWYESRHYPTRPPTSILRRSRSDRRPYVHYEDNYENVEEREEYTDSRRTGRDTLTPEAAYHSRRSPDVQPEIKTTHLLTVADNANYASWSQPARHRARSASDLPIRGAPPIVIHRSESQQEQPRVLLEEVRRESRREEMEPQYIWVRPRSSSRGRDGSRPPAPPAPPGPPRPPGPPDIRIFS